MPHEGVTRLIADTSMLGPFVCPLQSWLEGLIAGGDVALVRRTLPEEALEVRCWRPGTQAISFMCPYYTFYRTCLLCAM
jgi:hypothetical protein